MVVEDMWPHREVVPVLLCSSHRRLRVGRVMRVRVFEEKRVIAPAMKCTQNGARHRNAGVTYDWTTSLCCVSLRVSISFSLEHWMVCTVQQNEL